MPAYMQSLISCASISKGFSVAVHPLPACLQLPVTQFNTFSNPKHRMFPVLCEQDISWQLSHSISSTLCDHSCTMITTLQTHVNSREKNHTFMRSSLPSKLAKPPPSNESRTTRPSTGSSGVVFRMVTVLFFHGSCFLWQSSPLVLKI